MHHMTRRSTLAAAALLTACGGGGSDGASAPPNSAPAITSASAVSVSETATGVIYTFEINDPDGDPVTLSVRDGADEASFDIDAAARTVSLTQALDFENPADGDGDNVYEISVDVRDDAGAVTAFTLDITVTDADEQGALSQIATGFTQPVFATPVPGTGLLAVVEKQGFVRVLDAETGDIESVPMLDVSGEVSTNGERGLLGLAFSPDFESDGRIYVNLTNGAGDTEIRRYQMFSGSSTQVDPATADVIFTTPQPAANHNAGWIGFSNEGLFYLPLGDGGGSGDPGENAQDVSEVLGKILRLDLDGDDYPGDDARDYAIPADNPYAGGGGRPEIYAIGLRNPYRASVDSETGDLFIGDVGQNAIEEIDRLGPQAPGTNFGWDTREGTQEYEGADDPAFTDPVTEYSHGSGPLQGQSVTGGYVYRGPVTQIQDHYVFGDFVSGNYWSVPVEDLQNGSTVPSSQYQRLNDLYTPDTGSIGNISSFGLDARGNLLIVDYSGSIYRLMPEA